MQILRQHQHSAVVSWVAPSRFCFVAMLSSSFRPVRRLTTEAVRSWSTTPSTDMRPVTGCASHHRLLCLAPAARPSTACTDKAASAQCSLTSRLQCCAQYGLLHQQPDVLDQVSIELYRPQILHPHQGCLLQTTGLVYSGTNNNTLVVFVSATAPTNGTAQAVDWLPGTFLQLSARCALVLALSAASEASACSADKCALPVHPQDLPATIVLPAGAIRSTSHCASHQFCQLSWQVGSSSLACEPDL